MNKFFEDKETRILTNRDENKFYSYVKSRLQSPMGIPFLIDDGKLITDPQEQTKLLNKYFSMVHTVYDAKIEQFDLNFLENPSTPGLANADFNQQEIFNVLCKLNSSFALGPEGLPNLFYKRLAYILSAPLASLFEIFFQSGSIPSDMWKLSKIISIFKNKGLPSSSQNYRPISNLCGL